MYSRKAVKTMTAVKTRTAVKAVKTRAVESRTMKMAAA